MYIDMFILLIIILVTLFYFKRFSNVVYALVIFDIILRILYFIRIHTRSYIPELNILLKKYVPINLIDIIDNYTSGLFLELLSWCVLIIYICFLFYTIRIFVKRRK